MPEPDWEKMAAFWGSLEDIVDARRADAVQWFDADLQLVQLLGTTDYEPIKAIIERPTIDHLDAATYFTMEDVIDLVEQGQDVITNILTSDESTLTERAVARRAQQVLDDRQQGGA
jgi:hypothetical protein